MPWPPVERLSTERLRLEQLRRRYAAQTAGGSADGAQWWLHWILRLRASDEPAGQVRWQGSLEPR